MAWCSSKPAGKKGQPETGDQTKRGGPLSKGKVAIEDGKTVLAGRNRAKKRGRLRQEGTFQGVVGVGEWT